VSHGKRMSMRDVGSGKLGCGGVREREGEGSRREGEGREGGEGGGGGEGEGRGGGGGVEGGRGEVGRLER